MYRGWDIGVRAGGVLAVESLLLTRNRHYDILATNPKNRRFEMKFIKSLESTFKSVKEEEVREFIYHAYSDLTDDSLLEELNKRYKLDIRAQLCKAAELTPVMDARWARFLPNTRFDLYMVWRNGDARRAFEEYLERGITSELGDHNFMVELSYHGTLPAALLVSAVPGYSFLYDYSPLIRDFQEVQFRNGRINVYATKDAGTSDIEKKLESLVFPQFEKGPFYDGLKGYLAERAENVRKQTDKIPDRVGLRCRDLDRLAALLLVTYRINEDLNRKHGEAKLGEIRRSRFSYPPILTTRIRLYEYVRGVTKLDPGLLSYGKDIDLYFDRPGKGFYYCPKMYEDFQMLKSMGMISEIVTPARLLNLDGSICNCPCILSLCEREVPQYAIRPQY